MQKVLTKFIVDAMLGKIAKKIRLLGYDTLYYSKIKDKRLVEIAKNEGRIIVTRDRQLFEQARKENLCPIFVSSKIESDQIIEIVKQAGIAKTYRMDIEMTRCSLCNTKLTFIPKEDAFKRDDIPHGVLEKENQFWICKSCNKSYWRGSHFDNIREYFALLNEKINQEN